MYSVKVIKEGSTKTYFFDNLEKLFTYVRYELMSVEIVEVHIEQLKICPYVENLK